MIIKKEKLQLLIKAVIKNKQLRDELSAGLGESLTVNEAVALFNKSATKGLLILHLDKNVYAQDFQLTKIKPNLVGRWTPVICDFCFTRQAGSKIGRITFERKRDQHKVGWLCCNALDCSQNARGLTDAAKESRKFLKEDLAGDRGAERLKVHLQEVVDALDLKPVEVQDVEV